MTNLQSTATRLSMFVFHLVFWCLSSKRHFATLTLKFLLNPNTKETMPNFSTPRNHRFKEVFCCWSSERRFGALNVSFIHRFSLVYLCVSCKQHFGVVIVKFLLNQITTHKIASLENIVTRLRIIVLCYSYSAYHQNHTLELLPRNCHLTPLWRKRWPIFKILSH